MCFLHSSLHQLFRRALDGSLREINLDGRERRSEAEADAGEQSKSRVKGRENCENFSDLTLKAYPRKQVAGMFYYLYRAPFNYHVFAGYNIYIQLTEMELGASKLSVHSSVGISYSHTRRLYVQRKNYVILYYVVSKALKYNKVHLKYDYTFTSQPTISNEIAPSFRCCRVMV